MMTKIFNRILLTAGLAFAAQSLMAADGEYLDQYLKAKIGRSRPATERQQEAARASTAYRDQLPVLTRSWVEQHLKWKLGRYSPAEEARIEAQQSSSASRAEPSPTPAAPSYIEQHLKGKLGRWD